MPEFQFEGFGDFVAMGGYAFYVWMAYGFFAIAIVWNLIQPVRARRKVLKLLKARSEREASWADQAAGRD